MCNQELADSVYKLKESLVLCLFFDDKKNPPQKVIYDLVVDTFEDLQVKGLYKHFEENIEGNIEVTAMANGVGSRPVIMKMGKEMAIILNLIVVLDEGKISAL